MTDQKWVEFAAEVKRRTAHLSSPTQINLAYAQAFQSVYEEGISSMSTESQTVRAYCTATERWRDEMAENHKLKCEISDLRQREREAVERCAKILDDRTKRHLEFSVRMLAQDRGAMAEMQKIRSEECEDAAAAIRQLKESK